MKLENELEVLKENLIINNLKFNPVQAYKLFIAAPEKGRNLSIQNIFYAYHNLKLTLTETEAMLMVKRFDSNRDGQLTFTDVCDMIIPKDERLSHEFNKRMPFET